MNVEQWLKGQVSLVSSSNSEISPIETSVGTSQVDESRDALSDASEVLQPSVSETSNTEVRLHPHDNDLPEVYEEDIDRMRQVFAINPKMQEMMDTDEAINQLYIYNQDPIYLLCAKHRIRVLNHQTNPALGFKVPQYFNGWQLVVLFFSSCCHF